MKTKLLIILAICGCTEMLYATSSSTYWTSMTLDFQSYKVFHITYDSYFTVFRKSADGAGDFPTDYGLTVGILPFQKVQMEVGFDLFEPSDHPFFLNAKFGSPENVLFKNSPALEIGIINAGTESGVTNQNTVYGVIGKSIPHVGRISVGPYFGNGDVLRDSNGNKDNKGFMIGYDRGFYPVKDGSFNRFVICGDYASGNNALGGGGFGLYTYFTKDIDLLTGPVWFNDEGINGHWKWTIQLDINLPKLP